MPLGDRAPVVHAGPAERVGADADALGADLACEVHHVGQIRDVGVEVVVAAAPSAAPVLAACVLRRLNPSRRISLARMAIHAVASVSAGPLLRRVVLESGVARRVVRQGGDHAVGQVGVSRPLLKVRMAWQTAGRRGDSGRPNRSSLQHRWRPAPPVRRPRLVPAGAWVSRPRNSRPVVPCAARYSTMAWVVAGDVVLVERGIRGGAPVPEVRTPPAAQCPRGRAAGRSSRSPPRRCRSGPRVEAVVRRGDWQPWTRLCSRSDVGVRHSTHQTPYFYFMFGHDFRELAAVFVGGAVGHAGARRPGGALGTSTRPLAVAHVHREHRRRIHAGYFTTRLLERLPSSSYRQPLVGNRVCGGLTTFSMMQVETVTMLGAGTGHWPQATPRPASAAGLLAVVLATALVRRAAVR